MISSDDRTRNWLLLAFGLVSTLGLVMLVVVLWPDGDDDPSGSGTVAEASGDDAGSDVVRTTVAGATGEPSEQTTVEDVDAVEDGPVDLFAGGDLAPALVELLGAAGDPAEVIELGIYPDYAILAYRDPVEAGHLDRRIWRPDGVGDAEPNPIDDRVDDDTAPELFAPTEIDPAAVERAVAATPQHFDLPVDITHVIVDRFLPFDERVLIRVYATPSDGRSGGGYVSFTTAGDLVEVIG